MSEAPLRVGTAGWSIPREHALAFPDGASALARYAGRLGAVEINTSFYRPHRPATYARWADTVPDGFRFAVKLPRTITHERRLGDVRDLLDRFLGEVSALGPKLGPILVQLPPSLVFDAERVGTFLAHMRERSDAALALEPRHASWFAPATDAFLVERRVVRVAADPAIVPAAAEPGGWPGLVYRRLHGSPRIYHSPYEPQTLAALATGLAVRTVETWCIFDNTASGAATGDALAVIEGSRSAS